jgi:hypothetical protein
MREGRAVNVSIRSTANLVDTREELGYLEVLAKGLEDLADEVPGWMADESGIGRMADAAWREVDRIGRRLDREEARTATGPTRERGESAPHPLHEGHEPGD